MRVAQAEQLGRLGAIDARTGAGGGWRGDRQPRSLGEAAEEDLPGPDASGGGLSRRRGGCWRSRVWVGPAVCWASPAPLPALPCSCTGQPGRRLEGPRVVRLAHGLRQVTATGRRSTTSGRGRRLAPGGVPGCRADSPMRGRLWLTGGPRIRLRPTYRNSRLGPPVRLAARTHYGRPLRPVAVVDEHTWQRPCDRGGPAHPVRQLRSTASQRPLVAHRSPAHPGADNGPRVHQPGRAEPA